MHLLNYSIATLMIQQCNSVLGSLVRINVERGLICGCLAEIKTSWAYIVSMLGLTKLKTTKLKRSCSETKKSPLVTGAGLLSRWAYGRVILLLMIGVGQDGG